MVLIISALEYDHGANLKYNKGWVSNYMAGMRKRPHNAE